MCPACFDVLHFTQPPFRLRIINSTCQVPVHLLSAAFTPETDGESLFPLALVQNIKAEVQADHLIGATFIFGYFLRLHLEASFGPV